MSIAGDLLINFISAVVFVGINGVVLWWLTLKLFKLKIKEPWKLAYTVALYAGIVSFVLGLFPVFISVLASIAATVVFFLINTIVLIYLIMRFYKQEIGKSVLIWLGVFIADLIIGFVIGLIIGLIVGLV